MAARRGSSMRPSTFLQQSGRQAREWAPALLRADAGARFEKEGLQRPFGVTLFEADCGPFLQKARQHWQQQGARVSEASIAVENNNAGQAIGSSTPSEGGSRKDCAVDPYNWYKIRWDVTVAVMIIYSVLVIPFRIGFGAEATGAAFAADLVIDCCFGIDIILTFFTGYYDDKEVLVRTHRLIAWRYVTSFFIIDFVSVFPTDYIMSLAWPDGNGSSARIIRILRLVRLMKLARLFRLKRLNALLEEHMEIPLHYLGMLKVIGVVIFLIHMLSCMCYWIATPVCPNGNPEPCAEGALTDEDRLWSSWVRMFYVDRLTLFSRYTASFYLVTATVMAVGYGDIYPVDSKERLLSIVVQLVGAVVFGFILSAVTTMIEASNNRDIERKRSLCEMKDWLQDRDLPPILRHRVWTQLNYQFKQKSILRNEHFLLKTLPTELRIEFIEHTHTRYIKSLQATFGETDRRLIAELALLTQPFQVGYGECLVEAGEPALDFFVVKLGRIEAVLDEQNLDDLEVLLAAGVVEPTTVTTTNLNASLSSLSSALSSPSPQFGSGPEKRRSLLQEFAAAPEARRGEEKSDITKSISLRAKSTNTTLRMTMKSSAAGGHFADDFVLCAIYLESEVFCDFPVNPVRVLGGEQCNEVLALNKEMLAGLLRQHPSAEKRFGIREHEARLQLWSAATSPGWSGGKIWCGTRGRRVKSRILYRGKAVAVHELPSEVFETEASSDSGDIEPVPMFATRRPASASDSSTGASSDNEAEGGQQGSVSSSAIGTEDGSTLVWFTDNETEEQILRRWIIPPGNRYKVRWDVFAGVLIMYSAIVIPCRFGFGLSRTALFLAVDVLVDISFVVDMVLSFRTGFLDSDGAVCTIPSEIRKRYVCGGWFAIDFLSTCPFDWIFEFGIFGGEGGVRAVKLVRVARLARFLKTLRLLKLNKLIALANASVEISPLMVRLVTLCIRIFFIAHIVACFWYHLASVSVPWEQDACNTPGADCNARIEESGSSNWIEAYGDEDSTFTNRYIISLYWVLTTMTTVGYGDITPANDLERIFTIVVMIFGATVFGYFIGSIAELSTVYADATGCSLRMLKEYCDEQVLCRRVQGLARRHYEFWYQEMTPYGYEGALLTSLPPQLRQETVLYIHRSAISSVSLFRRPLPDWFVAMLVRLLEPQAFGAGESILGPNEVCKHQDIFFVCAGFVEEMSPDVEVVSSEGSEVPALGYGPGSAFGFEPILSEAGAQGLLANAGKLVYFSCSKEGPCELFALRHRVLQELHITQLEFSQTVQDVLGETILREAYRRRRLLERQRGQHRDIDASSTQSSARADPTSPSIASVQDVSSGATLHERTQRRSWSRMESRDELAAAAAARWSQRSWSSPATLGQPRNAWEASPREPGWQSTLVSHVMLGRTRPENSALAVLDLSPSDEVLWERRHRQWDAARSGDNLFSLPVASSATAALRALRQPASTAIAAATAGAAFEERGVFSTDCVSSGGTGEDERYGGDGVDKRGPHVQDLRTSARTLSPPPEGLAADVD